MNKIIFNFCLFSFSTFCFASLDPNESCNKSLENHLAIVKETNIVFQKISQEKNKEMSSFDVLLFEHNLETRYSDLLTLKKVSCELIGPREIIIQSDFIDLSKKVLSDFKLRRIVSILVRYKKENFANFKKYYNHYTMTETLEDNLNILKIENKNIEISALELNLSLENISPLMTPSDLSIKALSGVIGELAKIWGKLSDKTIWREGRLKNNQQLILNLEQKLKPFDLIYESRNYTLSHFTIPGHFGHVAIWLGTKENFIELGIWDKEELKPFREQIEIGNNILEVRKTGIQFVALKNFINLDEIAVTRILNIQNSGLSIFQNLFEQFNKKYDFVFDAHTSNKITCTELISFAYGNIAWPMSDLLSIVSLRPDDLAKYMVINPNLSEFVGFYTGNKDSTNFETKTFEDFKKLFN